MTDGPALPVTERDGGVAFAVKALPGSRADRVHGWHGGALKIAVAAPPERGRANERIRAVLAGLLGVPVRDIAIVRGASSPQKLVFVAGITAARARELLSGA